MKGLALLTISLRKPQAVRYTLQMNFRTLITSLLIFLGLAVSIARGQTPSISPTPPDDFKGPVKELKLSFPSIKDELKETEIEPRSKLFKMNLRFIRAQYSRPNQLGQQYDWYYFPEASITVQFFQYAEGKFSSLTPEEAKNEVAKLMEADIQRANGTTLANKDIKVGTVSGTEMEVTLQGKTLIVRTFTSRDVRYVLIAQGKTPEAAPLIKKALDSFQFVTDKQ